MPFLGGSGGLLLAECKLILATCQKLENDRRPPLERFPNIGKLPNLGKAPGHHAMQGVHLQIYYIYFNFGQNIHPIDSDQPLWAAVETRSNIGREKKSGEEQLVWKHAEDLYRHAN